MKKRGFKTSYSISYMITNMPSLMFSSGFFLFQKIINSHHDTINGRVLLSASSHSPL